MVQSAKLKAIDFFSGAGGMSCGLMNSGIEIIGGVDFDKDSKATYEENISEYLLKDIRKLKFSELEDKWGLKRKDDHLVMVGCSPCQYWSKMNTDKNKSQIGMNLLANFQKFVNYFQPGYVVIENVPGILRQKSKSPLEEFKRFLKRQKYQIDNEVIDTINFGVPQRRKRYLLIATRLKSGGLLSLPEKTEDENLTVRNFIGDTDHFPEISQGHIDKSDYIHSTTGLSKNNQKRILLTPHNGGTRMAWKDTDLQINAYKNKDNLFSNVYGRMYWDKAAPTITTRFNSLSNGRFGHPEQNRALSLREGATLQTFPIDFIFRGSSIHSIAKQIGNAVPPSLAEKIGQTLLSHAKIWQDLKPKPEQLTC